MCPAAPPVEGNEHALNLPIAHCRPCWPRAIDERSGDVLTPDEPLFMGFRSR
jgi:hypothetical protein